MGPSLCKLSLVCPRDIKTALADILDDLTDAVPGYTMLPCEGRGADMHLASAGERVRGAMQAVQFLMILPRGDVETILDTVAARCPRRQIAYWIEPVEEFGRLI
ncbi:hypothetical protein OA2633_11430 [Oceanicaulis alexandrii HTCC2633]|uniref:DUF3240 family protein n=1 Tax=Oceanicaulis sp. HTCC2633 TaxID=314254 RepID=UPI0000668BAB|nr:DUF3240 family protein [Oceanicaulis sp. HTCC2633]EAP90309.1 hypothetical protein OA2633_11430 [Oceanicaulis alexandrii HTCC2633] [Oceanicaulis sp. HTCC2633]